MGVKRIMTRKKTSTNLIVEMGIPNRRGVCVCVCVYISCSEQTSGIFRIKTGLKVVELYEVMYRKLFRTVSIYGRNL